jgi:hypothetical protein
MKGDIVTDEMLQQQTENIRSLNGVQLVMELTNEKIRIRNILFFNHGGTKFTE